MLCFASVNLDSMENPLNVSCIDLRQNIYRPYLNRDYLVDPLDKVIARRTDEENVYEEISKSQITDEDIKNFNEGNYRYISGYSRPSDQLKHLVPLILIGTDNKPINHYCAITVLLK